MVDASSLQSAMQRLRKVEATSLQRVQQSLESESDMHRDVRAVTGIHTDEARVAYFLDGGIDAWYDEIKQSLESKGKPIDDVTFPTTLVSLSRDEKLILHTLFKEVFGDIASAEDSSDTAKQKCADKQDYFAQIEKRVATIHEKLRSSTELSSVASRIENAVLEKHGGAAFVKLTTRSPKDSYDALAGARRSLQDQKQILSASEVAEGEEDKHSLLWTTFAEELRLQQRVASGDKALLLLATSNRVYEDLTTDLFENPGGKDQIQLSIRTFDSSVTPQTEFRGFVWDKRFVCCGQYFHQLYFPDFQDDVLLARISADLRRFYDETILPNMSEFLGKCPCFMMDLIWKQDTISDAGASVMLTEINPFDGEAIGVFPASTGLFSWDDVQGDRQLMMGKSLEFEPRVRKEVLITAKNLRTHPELRNLSPVWKEAIYGHESR